MSNKMKVRIICVVLSADLEKSKRLVLSKDKNETTFPAFYIDSKNIIDVRSLIIDHLKEFLAVNPIDLIPTIISVNPSSIPEKMKQKDTLDIVYGILTPYDPSTMNHDVIFWNEFSLVSPDEYSNLIFEVLQSLS